MAHVDGSALTLMAQDAMQCPFATYDRIRAESPAYRDAVTGFFVVTRYADIRDVAADPATFSNRTGLLGQRSSAAQEEVERIYAADGVPRLDTLVTNDPPGHRRYRALVDKAFTTMRVREAEPSIAIAVDELIDRFPEGPFDFAQDFATALPVRIIAEQLGVPPARAGDFKRWSDALIESANQGLTGEQEIAAARSIVEMQVFFREMVVARRGDPDSSLLSDLANIEVEGDLMTVAEVVSLLQQLLVAGNETTTNALASGMLRLVEDGALQDELRQNPDLIPNFCEEVLRLDSPLQGLFRRVTRDTRIGDVPIPEGAILDIRWGGGNRDARRFAEPDRIDLRRNNPSQHLAFGFGIHFCIGNQLARAELRLAFARLLERSGAIRLAGMEEAVGRRPHFFAYGISRLMLDFSRA